MVLFSKLGAQCWNDFLSFGKCRNHVMLCLIQSIQGKCQHARNTHHQSLSFYLGTDSTVLTQNDSGTTFKRQSHQQTNTLLSRVTKFRDEDTVGNLVQIVQDGTRLCDLARGSRQQSSSWQKETYIFQDDPQKSTRRCSQELECSSIYVKNHQRWCKTYSLQNAIQAKAVSKWLGATRIILLVTWSFYQVWFSDELHFLLGVDTRKMVDAEVTLRLTKSRRRVSIATNALPEALSASGEWLGRRGSRTPTNERVNDHCIPIPDGQRKVHKKDTETQLRQSPRALVSARCSQLSYSECQPLLAQRALPRQDHLEKLHKWPPLSPDLSRPDLLL